MELDRRKPLSLKIDFICFWNSEIMMTLESAMQNCAFKVDNKMACLLPKPENIEAPLLEAMRYCSLGGGKRIRPFIIQQSAKLFGVDERYAMRVGAAVEFMHCYSLIHDDLPAMDDSDFRRGKLSCHKKFDYATAILAGDALQSLAFEVLTAEETHSDPNVRCKLVRSLAKAVGTQGMAGGQMIDIRAEKQNLSVDAVTRMQRLKTGEVFSFCATAGAIMGQASNCQFKALHNFAQQFGLAFQIADDLLDVKGDPEKTGKPVNQDLAAGKETYISILGIERSHAKAKLLSDRAIRALDLWGESANLLRKIATYIVERDR